MKFPVDILQQFEAAQTLRCHTLPTQRRYNLAEHSYGVAMLCDYLTGGLCSAQLLRVALHHDLPECVTGDVPHPVKQRNPRLACALDELEREYLGNWGLVHEDTLSPEEQETLHVADMLEFLLFCHSEVTRGNTSLMKPIDTALRALRRRKLNKRALDLITTVKEEIRL